MNAIILSAGLGTRLRPITENIPKPLLPIVHRPIIEVNIERLINRGIENIGVNLFHKADMIKKFLKESSSHLHIVVEKKLRGTGGALLNFRDLIKDDVIIHNVDVLSNIDIGAAIEFHKFQKPLATLILTDRCGTNVLKIWTIADLSSLGTNITQTQFFGLWIFIKDSTALAKFKSSGTALEIKLGSDTGNYFSLTKCAYCEFLRFLFYV